MRLVLAVPVLLLCACAALKVPPTPGQSEKGGAAPPAALYKQAVASFKLEEYKKVFHTLDRMPLDVSDGPLLVRAASLRVSTARKFGREPNEEMRGYLELVDAYDRLSPSDEEVRDLNWIVGEKRALEAVKNWADDPGQEVGPFKGLMKKWEGRKSASYILWKLAFTAHEKGNYGESTKYLEEYLQNYPKQEYAGRARTLLAEVNKREPVGRLTIGVLLPLSGPYAVYGESILHGLECAAGVYQPCHGFFGANLVIKDTEGTPKGAVKGIQELADDANIKVVIGPLAQVEVEEAATAAEAAGISLLTLSQKKDIAARGGYIFRNFLTVADQVATIVQYACEEKGWKKLAVLYPKGGVGEEYAQTFQSEVERCGGKVTGSLSYPPNTADFSDVLRALKSSGGRVTLDEKIPFEAVFIPDVYRKVPAIVQGMEMAEMKDVHLLGGAGWDNPALAAEGAVFVDGFFAAGGGFATRDFVGTFEAAYGVPPTLLEAYAYDSLKLAGSVLHDHPSASREEVRDLLGKVRGFDGVTGTISFDEEGDARRRLFLLTVENGRIREVR